MTIPFLFCSLPFFLLLLLFIYFWWYLVAGNVFLLFWRSSSVSGAQWHHTRNNGGRTVQTYAADIFFSQTWQDYRLRFPDNLTADYRLLPTSWLNSMWRPDSFFKNAKKVTFQDVTIPNHYIWLYKDKSILYMVKWVPWCFLYLVQLGLKLWSCCRKTHTHTHKLKAKSDV